MIVIHPAVDHGDDLAYCFPVLDEAGQYERADAPSGGTAWDATRALAPAAIVWPDAILRVVDRPVTGEFPLGWDRNMAARAVATVARDPDRITWDDPCAWPGAEHAGRPCWRVEGSVGAVTITVAVSADGEITGARVAERSGRPWTLARQRGRTRV